MNERIPVTVLTGFLGSGKTTLLNRILSETHGQRIAVIENEFGEIGVDQDLVINAEEEIFEMNNGCICCTVRGDLIRILGNLVKRRDRFDRVVLETTGLADPGPVAQTFFVDDEIKENYVLDGVITLVDAKHILLHLDESDEALAQIAFADRLLVNKTDLVTTEELQQVEQRLQGINAMAKLLRVQMADAPMDELLGIGGFDLQRALETRPGFLEPEYPFEWGGLFELERGEHQLVLKTGPDPSLELFFTRVEEDADNILQQTAEQVFRHYAEPACMLAPGTAIQPGLVQTLLLTSGSEFRFPFSIPSSGRHALFTQHFPSEFALHLQTAEGSTVTPTREHAFNAAHSHDNSVSSVSIEAAGNLHEKLFFAWIGTLLRRRGEDIFRSKGIVSLEGDEQRYIFQGVHMLLDGTSGAPWGNEPRRNRLVFIGRNLDRDTLEEEFQLCLV
jgi:G3E family GTPase